ncbi:heavy metal translocating P-type ATPase [Actinoplanes sp. N902-109]|uniref:heavy metal translocating P-type ATPase n=1 Tax=Actinoplanes sp. (strain N902-109) TaxID=649831 RepID=UPI0003293B56|nr:heavy metal translocating P-type ATPase [Actinoplanes sp. N902-109]AGL18981.1 heavy metal translocating P-type ATPase [Actinoplanes sp. N902-109]
MTLEERTRPAVAAPPPQATHRAGRWWPVPEVRWATAATLLFGLGLAAQLSGAPGRLWWPLYLACCTAGGWEPGWAGLRALRERRLDVDLLMVVAAACAAAIGQIFDGALLIVIFATSGALEAVATRRTEDSVRGLLDLAPEQANRVTPDGAETVATAELRVGDVIAVRPGDRIGADGHVVAGRSEVDQAGITGEPLPAGKQPGDEVYAGTVNGTGALRVRVARPAADSVVARIVTLVEQASATKARTQLFIERVEQWYSIGMVAATLLLFTIPLLAGAELEPTLLRAMTFMIVASPCAVVLATMPPLLSAIATAGRHGVLIKSAVVLEHLGTATRVAFDKTGTLTEGRPRLSTIRPLPGTGITEPDLLTLAASAEEPAEHPLARAVVAAARERRLALRPAQSFGSAPGRGVTAQVDGRRIWIGSPARVPGHRPPAIGAGAVRRAVAALEHDGETVVLVAVDDRPAGILGFTDRLRPGAQSTVGALRELTGATPVLLTGDNAAAAERIAAAAGIDEVHAGLLPEQKAGQVRRQEAAGHRLLLVGDGVNDAPALAAAHAGIAMGGSGADLSIATADAVIVRDDLTAVPAVIALSRRARRLVTANLVVAAAFIVLLAGWDLLGHLPLPLGVAGHEGSTVIVGLNGLRLLRSSAWRRAAGRPGQRSSS